jgi:hypothetical protein
MVISTKLPIVKDLIEIIMLVQMYQNDMKMVLDRYTALQERIRCKAKTHVKLFDTCKAQGEDT